jgi:hypothetical protein
MDPSGFKIKAQDEAEVFFTPAKTIPYFNSYNG